MASRYSTECRKDVRQITTQTTSQTATECNYISNPPSSGSQAPETLCEQLASHGSDKSPRQPKTPPPSGVCFLHELQINNF